MMRGKLIAAGTTLAMSVCWNGDLGAQPPPTVSFKASVDMVRVAAVVRDHKKGRFVHDANARDFEILDGGEARAIKDFRHDLTGVSVAILFDVSGSMEGHQATARWRRHHVTDGLEVRPRRGGRSSVRRHLDGRRSRLRLKRLPAENR